jgi:hypothetical protein
VRAIRYELRGESPEEGLIDELAAVHPRIGVDGLLERRGTRARPGRVPAEAAVEGFRWGLFDGWAPRWWPQGVEVLSGHGDGILVVSWFAQGVRGASRGARISVVDRRDPRRPSYHHVLLVEAVRGTDGAVSMEPVQVHAGGLARVGHQLYAAATFGGLRVFDLRDILRVTGRPSRSRAPFGYRCVLPQSGHQRLNGGKGGERMRFSFVSLEREASGQGDGGHLVVGEFGPHKSGRRLGRVPVAGVIGPTEPTQVVELHEPGIARMQGAAVIDGTWFVSASNGVKPGDLWVGAGLSWTRHRGVLPAGPEDLAATPDGHRLWSLCEYPRRRWVYAIDARRWRDEPAPLRSSPPDPA